MLVMQLEMCVFEELKFSSYSHPPSLLISATLLLPLRIKWCYVTIGPPMSHSFLFVGKLSFDQVS